MNQLPSLPAMAKELVKTAKDVVSHAATTGVISVSEEKSSKRMDVCLACEFLIKEQTRCSKCGCFMKSKVILEAAKCPESKW